MALSLIFSALIAAAQLPAGTSEGVACVVERTSPTDRLAIADGALGPEAPPGAAAEAEGRFSGHLSACAEQYGWDEPQLLRVSTLGIAALVRGVAQGRLAGAGIDSTALDLWFDRQSEEFRTTAFHTMSEDEAAAAILTLEGDVLAAGQLDAHAGLIGGYLAMRVLAVRVEAGLPVQ
jgi:hypothetical protein